MDPRHMGWIQQIVGHKKVVAVDAEGCALVHTPSRIIEIPDLENLAGVRQRGIAHPDPDQPISFLCRVGADLGVRRDRALTGGHDALASAV